MSIGGLKFQTSMNEVVVHDKRKTNVQSHKKRNLGCTIQISEDREGCTVDNQENRMVNNLREHPKESLASLGKKGLDRGHAITKKEGSVQGEMEIQQLETLEFKFEFVAKAILNECQVGLDSTKGGECGDCCKAAPLSPVNILAWNCWGLGLASAERPLTDEVKDNDPILVFLAENKAN